MPYQDAGTDSNKIVPQRRYQIATFAFSIPHHCSTDHREPWGMFSQLHFNKCKHMELVLAKKKLGLRLLRIYIAAANVTHFSYRESHCCERDATYFPS